MEAEIWKSIPGYEGHYEASNMGRVRSLDREVVYSNGVARLHRGRVLALHRGSHGRLLVNLWREGRMANPLVYRVVLLAFQGPPQPGEICRHLNGDPNDNRLENLAYGTYKDNSADAKAHGTAYWRSGRRPMTEESVRELLRDRYVHGLRYRELMRKYDLCLTTVSDTSVGVRWRSVYMSMMDELGLPPPVPPRPSRAKGLPRKAPTALPDDAALRLLHEYHIDRTPEAVLAERYGVAPRTVHRLVRGTRRNHLYQEFMVQHGKDVQGEATRSEHSVSELREGREDGVFVRPDQDNRRVRNRAVRSTGVHEEAGYPA